MVDKEIKKEIFSALLKTDIQIQVAINQYKNANNLNRFQVADRYHNLTKYLYRVKNILWKLNKNKQYEEKEIITISPMNPVYKFILSTELLFRMNNYLIDEGDNEKYCYGTGIINKSNNEIIPSEILTPKMAEQSPVIVRGDIRSIKDALTYLDQFGHTVVLQCHRHPGRGPGSTHPSGLDIKTHKAWEVFYPLIGAIFVKDGYFRFFSAGRKFQIEIFGKGVKQIDKTTFCFNH